MPLQPAPQVPQHGPVPGPSPLGPEGPPQAPGRPSQATGQAGRGGRNRRLLLLGPGAQVRAEGAFQVTLVLVDIFCIRALT